MTMHTNSRYLINKIKNCIKLGRVNTYMNTTIYKYIVEY